MKITFEKSENEKVVPTNDGKFSIAEHATIQKEFIKFKGKGSGISALRQPCHIIACVATKNGVTCWYHCIHNK